MSDLIHRSQKAKTLASDPPLPKWKRLSQGLQAFSGLELTGIPEDVRERFEADLVGVNRVLAQYPLETEEDYRRHGPLPQSWVGLSPTSMPALRSCRKRRFGRSANTVI